MSTEACDFIHLIIYVYELPKQISCIICMIQWHTNLKFLTMTSF